MNPEWIDIERSNWCHLALVADDCVLGFLGQRSRSLKNLRQKELSYNCSNFPVCLSSSLGNLSRYTQCDTQTDGYVLVSYCTSVIIFPSSGGWGENGLRSGPSSKQLESSPAGWCWRSGVRGAWGTCCASSMTTGRSGSTSSWRTASDPNHLANAHQRPVAPKHWTTQTCKECLMFKEGLQ